MAKRYGMRLFVGLTLLQWSVTGGTPEKTGTRLPLLSSAEANCNIIPPKEFFYPSTLGSVSNPIAAPGRPIELHLNTCDGPGGFTSPASTNSVSMTFDPPNGPSNAVPVPALPAAICGSGVNVGQTCSSGLDCCPSCTNIANCPACATTCLPSVDDCAGGGSPCNTLRFVLPATAGAFPPDGLAGPASITVTNTNGTVAQIDALSRPTRICSKDPDPVFGHFTALPPPNTFTDSATQVLATVDGNGGLIVPFSYVSALPGQPGQPTARFLKGTTGLQAFESSRCTTSHTPCTMSTECPTGETCDPGSSFGAVHVPSSDYLGSFTIDGRELAPLLRVTTDGGFFGTADGAEGIIRIAKSIGGPDIFDVTDRLESNIGPIIIDSGAGGVMLQKEAAVPLNALHSSGQAAAFAARESLEGDLNGDGDTSDRVVQLLDVATGTLTNTGLAVTEVGEGITGEGPLPALETSGSLVAFLVSEAHQGGLWPGNGDEDMLDNDLQVFHLPSTTEVTNQFLTADDQPLVNGHSLAISGDKVFIRAPEAGRRTVRVSVATDGTQGNYDSGWVSLIIPGKIALSPTGRFVVFPSAANNLLGPGGDTNLGPGGNPAGGFDIFLRDRDTSGGTDFDRTGHVSTARVSVASDGSQANGPSFEGAVSADGRFVAFQSGATNLIGSGDTNPWGDIFVRDTCFSDGVPVSGCTATTTRASVSTAGTEADGNSYDPGISADGRFVLFASQASNLVAGDTNGAQDVFVRDTCVSSSGPVAGCTPATTRVSVSSTGDQGNGDSPSGVLCSPCGGAPVISADGRFIAFDSAASNLVADDTNGVADVFVHDTCVSSAGAVPGCTPSTTRVSVSSTGGEGDGNTVQPSISATGRYVAFTAFTTAGVAHHLVQGVGFGIDVFVRDRDLDGNGVFDEPGGVATSVVSIDSKGIRTSGSAFNPTISADGRYVAFNDATDRLAPGSPCIDCLGVFLRDRLLGITTRLSVSSAGVQGVHPTAFQDQALAISGDGHQVAFSSDVSSLVDFDTNGKMDVFVNGLDPLTTSPDQTGDGDNADAFLRSFDTSISFTGPLGDPLAVGQLGVANGRVAFLTAEADQVVTPNNDADNTDVVARVYDANEETITPLQIAADRVAVSANLVALTVPEAQQGNPPASLNAADSDILDDVLAVWVIGSAVPPPIVDGGHAADAIGATDVCDSGANTGKACQSDTDCTGGACRGVVAFVTPESAEGAAGTDLNGDGDVNDRVLQIYAQASGQVTNLQQAVVDFVVGGHLVAFRTNEGAQGVDLNGDGVVDPSISVMQVFDLTTGALVNTGQAAILCTIPGCEGIGPYKVEGDSVTFLTRESEQGKDLNGDGDSDDSVLQVFNVRANESQVFEAAEAGRDPIPPAPEDFLGKPILYVQMKESQLGQDINLDGTIDDSVVVVISGDNDGDGIFNESRTGGDLCADVSNPLQQDADGDGVGDTCDATRFCDDVTPASPPHAAEDDAVCQTAIGKAGRIYLKKYNAAVRACLGKVAAGKLTGEPTSLCRGGVVAGTIVPPRDPLTAAKLVKAQAKLLGTIDQACGGGLGGLVTCADTVGGVKQCVQTAYTQQGYDQSQSTFGAVGAISDSPTRACQAAVGRESAKYLAALVTTMQGCLDRINAGKLIVPNGESTQSLCIGQLSSTSGVIAPTDTVTQGKVQDAEAVLRDHITKRCGGGVLSGVHTCGTDPSSEGDCLVCTDWQRAVAAVRSAYGPR